MKIAFYKHNKNFVSKLVKWWTHGDYSHCELIIQEKDGLYLCGSVIPFKRIELVWKQLKTEQWDIIDCPIGNSLHAQIFFEKIVGLKYDYLGLLGFIFRRGQQLDHRWFCSEAIAAAIGLKNPWRYCPNTLFDIIYSLRK